MTDPDLEYDAGRVIEMPPWVMRFGLCASVVAVLFAIGPQALISPDWPMSGDLAGHDVWVSEFARLLRSGRVVGWTMQMGAGSPLGHFYFPLPAALASLLGWLFSPAVGLKLVVAVGPIVIVVGARRLAKGVGSPPLVQFTAPFAAVIAVTYTYADGLLGGSIGAAVRGEFSFTLALGLALCAAAQFAMAVRGESRWWPVPLLIASTVLSHSMVAVMLCGVLLAWTIWLKPSRRHLVRAAGAVVLGFGLASVWLFPMMSRFSEAYGYQRAPLADIGSVAPGTWAIPVVTAWVYFLWGFHRRRSDVVLLMLTDIVAMILFVLPWQLVLWNARALPLHYLVCAVASVAAVTEVSSSVIASRWSSPAAVRVAAVGVGGLAILLGMIQHWPDRADYQQRLRGVDGLPAEAVYDDLMDVSSRLPPGRAMYENIEMPAMFGAETFLRTLPRATHNQISDTTTRFHEAVAGYRAIQYTWTQVSDIVEEAIHDDARGNPETDFEQGVEAMRRLGVRYFYATTPAGRARSAASPGLELVATAGDSSARTIGGPFWEIYEVRGHTVVTPLAASPAVLPEDSDAEWRNAAFDWWTENSGSPSEPIQLAETGPREWTDATSRHDEATISNLEISDDRVSFTTDRPGVPVLVRVSYFPNWSVSGALGPWRVAPNFMVVVPKEERVVMTFDRDWTETLGALFSFGSLIAIVAWGLWQSKGEDREEPGLPPNQVGR